MSCHNFILATLISYLSCFHYRCWSIELRINRDNVTSVTIEMEDSVK